MNQNTSARTKIPSNADIVTRSQPVQAHLMQPFSSKQYMCILTVVTSAGTTFLQGSNLRTGWSVASSVNRFQIATNTGERGNFNGGPTTQRQVYYQASGQNEDDLNGDFILISFTCNLTSTYVELNISCIDPSCSATQIRPSEQNAMSELWSPLDYHSSVADSFFGDFLNATVPRQLASPSATEWYVTDPTQLFGIDPKN